MNQKYKVKSGCSIQHNNQPYTAGDIIELDSELALFHAANIETVKEKSSPTVSKKTDTASSPKSIDAE